MKQRLILFTLFLLPFALFSRVITIKKEIYWDVAKETVIEGLIENSVIICSSCQINIKNSQLPEIVEKINLQPGEYIKSVTFRNFNTESINDFSFSNVQKNLIRENSPLFDFGEGIERSKWKGSIRFTPLVKKGGKIEKIVQYEIEIDIAKGSFNASSRNKSSFSTSSVLKK